MINLTEKELDATELDGDTLVRLNLSLNLYDLLATLAKDVDIIFECKYPTLLKLSKALGINLVSRKQYYVRKALQSCVRLHTALTA